MRKTVMVGAPLALLVTGCALFGGSKTIDPLAGWGGLWVGEYRSEAGDVAPLELEFGSDTAGAPVGLARFDSGGGMQEETLGDLVLTEDSVSAWMEFDGLYSEVEGGRTAEGAEGTYGVWPVGGDQMVDSGTWRVTRRPRR